MKRILVPVEHTDHMASILETAVQFARRFDSHIEGFALRVALADFVAFDGGSAAFAEALAAKNLAAEKEDRDVFEAFMRERGVPRAESPTSLSYRWFDEAPEGNQFVGTHGRVFDLTVVGRPDPAGPGMAVLEVALFESGHPILIAPPSPRAQIGTNVLIAWNCSAEQAHATSLAIPILRKAERVTVLSVEGSAAVIGPPADELCRYLECHGISARKLTADVKGHNAGETILSTAASLNCDLLIKGAYTQSRLRQMIFGGATRHILSHATLPVFMAY
jgi:nucleotide-binding universal stress UspA family protein